MYIEAALSEEGQGPENPCFLAPSWSRTEEPFLKRPLLNPQLGNARHTLNLILWETRMSIQEYMLRSGLENIFKQRGRNFESESHSIQQYGNLV